MIEVESAMFFQVWCEVKLSYFLKELSYPKIRNSQLQLQRKVTKLQVRNLCFEGWKIFNDKVFDGNISFDNILTEINKNY